MFRATQRGAREGTCGLSRRYCCRKGRAGLEKGAEKEGRRYSRDSRACICELFVVGRETECKFLYGAPQAGGERAQSLLMLS